MLHIPDDNAPQAFEIVPAGSHVAICYRVIDLGTHPKEFQGQMKHVRQLMLQWELPHELMMDGRPFAISKRYTHSMHEKAALRRDLEAWRGAPYKPGEITDVAQLLGHACLLNIMHRKSETNGKTYANVAGVMQLPKGTKVPPAYNESLCFSLDERPFNVHHMFEMLPQWQQELISKSPEYAEATMRRPEAMNGNDSGGLERFQDGLDDDIPF